MAQPSPKGRAMPAAPTLNAIRQLLTRNLKSTSRPTRNKNSTRPKFAAKVRAGIEAVGKMALLKPGIRPITEGPNKMPAITSAMTRGCRSRDRGKCKSRQKIRIMPAFHVNYELATCIQGFTVLTWMMKRIIGFFGS